MNTDLKNNYKLLELVVSILAGERYIALFGNVRRAIFSKPNILNKSTCTIGLGTAKFTKQEGDSLTETKR